MSRSHEHQFSSRLEEDLSYVADFTATAEVPTSVNGLFHKEYESDMKNVAQVPKDYPSASSKIQGCDSFQVDGVNKTDEESSTLAPLPSHESIDVDSSRIKSTQKVLSLSVTEEHEKKMEELDICDSHEKNTKDTANILLKCILRPVIAISQFCSKHKEVILKTTSVLFAIGITVYMIVACFKHFTRALPLFIVWLLVAVYNIFARLQQHYKEAIWKFFKPCYKCVARKKNLIKWLFIAFLFVCLIIWIAVDTSKRPRQIISGLGYLVVLFGLFITSKYPDKVVWRPVLWGLLIQICLGLFVLRTQAGFDAFNWLGHLVETFINYVDVAAAFVFGASFADHYFAFKVLPLVLYFSSFISILYYLGAMQWIILKLAWLMQISLNTSATESMVAAGNIFVGQTESPLLIRPYLEDLTTSELHAVMTAGFGTIAGSVLGAYISFGIQPLYVITACVMAAPCALAVSKLVYPETKQSKFLNCEGLALRNTDQHNILEAAFVGASQAIPLILNIGGNLIAFLSLLAAVNGFLNWFGGLVDYPQLSFEVICSYIFMPVSFLMGVDWQDCFKAGELIGKKIFLNEFIAYQSLAEMIKLRDSGIVPKIQPDTGVVNWVDEHTEAIVTYALCGFANFGSVGIMLGGLGSMVESRQSEMTKIVLRALVAGVFVSILNACIAGFLYVPRPIICDGMLATTNWTYAEPGRLHQCCLPTL
ncbi:sodium/nucleoside cotransporter 1-like [Clavelina lepadiformis]|uniref:sodium/nucleoside cotransporter 1-like n=1 Tax=Clavelina lepadiformis TaxID=159417 RepID=UPI0040419784